MFDYFVSSIPLAVIAGVIVVILDLFFLREAINKIKKGEYGNYSVIVGVLSFLLTKG